MAAAPSAPDPRLQSEVRGGSPSGAGRPSVRRPSLIRSPGRRRRWPPCPRPRRGGLRPGGLRVHARRRLPAPKRQAPKLVPFCVGGFRSVLAWDQIFAASFGGYQLTYHPTPIPSWDTAGTMPT